MKRNIDSKQELADIIGIKLATLTYIVYKIPNHEKYYTFNIPKKSGGVREICSPVSSLKHIQTIIAKKLAETYEEMFQNYSASSSLSHGFRKNNSIVTNSTKHKNRRYVFNIDLEKFFPSINFGRVRGFFIKSNQFNYSPEIATIIAQICCFNNELPQGSPVSPVLSNLITNMLDIKLVRLAKKYKCTYSRYADDITFSTNQKLFPVEIATLSSEGIWKPGLVLTSNINSSGFKINHNKTTMQYKTSRQVVTGLTVNKIVNINRNYYKETRAFCSELFRTGEYYLKKEIVNINGEDRLIKIKGNEKQLEGRLSYIYNIRKRYYIGNNNKHNCIGIVKLYKLFLVHKYFISNCKPTIVVEGKTDTIYFKCALQNLAMKYPDLVRNDDDITEYAINFLNYTNTLKEIFGISSGTSGQIDLIKSIMKYKDHYLYTIKKRPVIFVFDNDKGSNIIKNMLKNEFGVTKVDCSRYYNIHENVYVVFSTIVENTEIEDLFDTVILDAKIGNKVFNRSIKMDSNNEYSKIVFAEKIIRLKWKEINFSKFERVFDFFKEIIKKNITIAST